MDQAYLDITPVQAPPNGTISNFVNPPNNIPLFKLTLGICLATNSFFLLLRVLARFFIQKVYEWEDCKLVWINHPTYPSKRAKDNMIFAWAGNVIWISFAWYLTSYGVGVLHMWDVSLSQLAVFLKVRFSAFLPPLMLGQGWILMNQSTGCKLPRSIIQHRYALY